MTNYEVWFGTPERAASTMDTMLSSCFDCPLNGTCTTRDEKPCTYKLYKWMGMEAAGYVKGVPHTYPQLAPR